MRQMTDIAAALIPDFDLTAHNTMALRARSRFGVMIDQPTLLPALFDHAAAQNLPVRVLGGGSNVVLAPEYDGITALLTLPGRKIIDQTIQGTLIEAAAGETWHDFVQWTVDQRLGGLENLALIPGTVGAAPVQNIGAYGAELADIFHSLSAYDRATGATLTFGKDECAFGYRDSIFKRHPNRYVVLAVRFALTATWTPNLGFADLSDLAGSTEISPRTVMDRVIELRTSKLPDWRETPNAGSFFQNPIVTTTEAGPVLDEFPSAPCYPQPDGRAKLSAGWLIEKSGLKGYHLGPAGISERHALVLVNHGGAQQADIAALASHIKQTVQTRFGIALHEEPIFL